jgi:crotonobetaine/carnitine-CoA ligase
VSVTFAQRWADAVAEHGERPFLVFDDLDGGGATWTYAAFDALIEEVAGGLASAGLGPGRALHVVQANGPAFLACWLAAVRLGAVLVPSDPRATDRELGEHAARTAPVVAVVEPQRLAGYRDAAPGVRAIAVSPSDVTLASLRGDAALGRCGIAAAGEQDGRAADPTAPAAVLFTSGTTSAPKGVVVTQGNYAFAGATMANAAAVTAEDRCLVVLPLFHANAQYYSCAAAIDRGACVLLMARFSASGLLAQARRHGATHASLFAAPIRMLLARVAPAGEPPLALRHCWFAQAITQAQYDAVAALLGCRPRQLYGMTETLPAVLTAPAELAGPTAMGTVTPGCAVRVVDQDTGGLAPAGVVGEIQVGGRPGYELFDGYLDDPATTRAAMHDGWFTTGDLALVGEDGQLRFAGRRGDVLKVAGENVSTVEVEAVLAEHPAVGDVAVVGMPDEIRDEVPVAHLVVRTAVGEDELAAWCAARLAPSKRPRAFVFHDELPRTSVGKIRKFQLTT